MTNGTNGTARGTNGSGLLPCWHCGGEAMVRKGIWFYVQCTACPIELGANYDADGNPDGEYLTEGDAVAAWNTRVAVTDHDFAMAVHDGELWGKCSECRERQGYYMDAETIRNQQERIAELDDELRKSYDAQGVKAEELVKRDVLIREMARELRGLNDDGVPTDCMEHERRMRELGVEVE